MAFIEHMIVREYSVTEHNPNDIRSATLAAVGMVRSLADNLTSIKYDDLDGKKVCRTLIEFPLWGKWTQKRRAYVQRIEERFDKCVNENLAILAKRRADGVETYYISAIG